MEIYRLGTTAKKYGGTIYEEMVDQAIAERHDLKVLRYQYRWRKPFRYFEIINLFFFYLKSNNQNGIIIRNLETCMWPSRKPTIYLVFHVDWNYSGLFSKFIQMWTWFVFGTLTPKNQPVVVISQFWKDFLIQKGFTNVHLIYCAFDEQEYNVTETEVNDFLVRKNLQNKKIIYIGNPQKKKGVDIAYNALKELKVELVCSGEGDIELPVRYLKLNFKDYLCLLRASTVVMTLSRFKEGWNRVAHEALLMGTPVIGSGRGGMGELLRQTDQKIINDENLIEIKSTVQEYMGLKPVVKEQHLQYLKSFNRIRFRKAWLTLIENIQQSKG